MIDLDSMQEVQIMGVRVDAVGPEEAAKAAEAMLAGPGGYITTPNPEMILQAQKDPEFKRILNNSALAIPDGAGIVWAAAKLGKSIKRIAGTDFLQVLARIGQKNGKKIALIGGGRGVAAKAGEKLGAKGFDCGEIDEKNIQIPENLLIEINNFAPEIIAVSLGQGKQEKFIAKLLPLVPSLKIAIGVGGALDYISGAKRRAPKWMQEYGLEWIWRLLSEPWRLPRIINAAIVFPIKFLIDYERKN